MIFFESNNRYALFLVIFKLYHNIPSSMELKKISIDLDIEIYRCLKHMAIDKYCTMSSLIRTAIEKTYGSKDEQVN